MTYLTLAYIHLATVMLAFALGTCLLLQKKGTALHRLVGKFFMGLMLLTALIALCMPAQIGPTLIGQFGFIHLFCLLIFYAVPSAYFAIRQGDLAKHKANLIGVYVGGFLIAGGFCINARAVVARMVVLIGNTGQTIHTDPPLEDVAQPSC